MQNVELDEVENTVREMISTATGIDLEDIKPDVHLYRDLGVDSIKGIELVVELQQKFGLRVDDAKIPELVTPRLIVEETKRLLAKKKASHD